MSTNADTDRPKRRRRSRGRGRGKSSEHNQRTQAGHDEPRPEVGPQPEVPPDYPFAQLGLRDSVAAGALAAGFTRPTEIQARLIPLIISGKDVLGQARTGTGKTASFALPILQMADPGTPVSALILAPTRELAKQIETEVNRLGVYTPLRATAIYGGEPFKKQINRLEKGDQIVVGTPGRVMDLHGQRILSYDNIRVVVLDEVDRMLDIGFRDDIRKILSGIRTRPQTVFVSATISRDIEELARRFMTNPEKVATVEGSLTVEEVYQCYFTVEPWDKRRLLHHLLTREEPDVTLVFCRTKMTVDKVAKYLADKGVPCRAIHGDMPQSTRNSVMKGLRGGSLEVVVASDVAARGLDVSNISHVINYDLPEDPEIYIHRIGRTARAGRRGIAWSFVTPEDGYLLTEIEKLANIHIPGKFYPEFQPGPIPESVLREREQGEKRKSRPTKSRYAPPPTPPTNPAEVDPKKFPGGIVPSGKPAKRLGGRVRTRRSRG